MSKEQNQVRQILMNELGLTRESVRAEIETIVSDTITRRMNSDQFTKLVEKQIDKAIQAAMKEDYYDTDSFKKKIMSVLTSTLKERVAEATSHLTVRIEEN